MKLTKHFDYEEFFVSREFPDIANKLKARAPETLITTIHLLCHFILQPVRDELMIPIVVTSGYRDKELNSKIGGSESSLHMRGIAADITIKDIYHDGKNELLRAYRFIRDKLIYGQLILYEDEAGNFINIHVSLPSHDTIRFAKRQIKK